MTQEKRKVEVCFSPISYPLFNGEDSIVVIIDVLRATSAICTALHSGVEGIIPVESVEEAREYHKRGFTVAAERHGKVVEGFELGNSPFSYMNGKLVGKTVVLTTTNGTQAVHAAKNANKIVIGSFLNLTVLSNWLIQENKDVVLLCAGWKNKFNLEDTLFAGAVIENLFASGCFENDCDSARASAYLYNGAKSNIFKFLEDSSHRNRLEALNLEEDIRYCLTPDQAPVIPILDGNTIVRLPLPELSTR